MTFKPALFAVFALAALAATDLGCAADSGADEDGQTAEALTSGRIVVQLGSPGPTLGKWGYDIKQDGLSKTLTPALADEIFKDIGMNMLRVAVRAVDAHPSQGVASIRSAAYAADIEAIKNAKAAKPSVDVFASLKLRGDKTFPAWVKDGGELDPAKYAELLEDYLAFMKDNGITVDWLGIDCERKWNEGNITPARWNATVVHVKAWCKAHGVKVPGFIAAEDYGPSEDTPWLQQLWQSPAKFSEVDNIGVHTYAELRNAAYVDSLRQLANNTHGQGLWDTELHWDDIDKSQDGIHFNDVKPGILTAMDHFDVGFRALSWWAFKPRSTNTKAAFIMSELVTTTLGASTLPTDDVDGKELGMNKFNVRAFENGPRHVTLWVMNFGGKDRKDQWTEIPNRTVASASYVQWSTFSEASGRKGSASVIAKQPSHFAMTYPADTITRVTVTLE